MLKENEVKKRACFLGDSITYGTGVKEGERYFDLLGTDLKIETHGYGESGARYIDLIRQAQRMYNDFGSDVDIVFVFAGTNNFNSSIPIGKWFDVSQEEVAVVKNADGSPKVVQKRKKRTFNTDPETFCGGINAVLSFLKHKYADKQIVLMTPIHRAFATFGNENIQYDETYSNNIGLFIDDYVEKIREASSIWATEIIDLYSSSGLFPLFDEGAHYFSNVETDRLHPGTDGHMRIADVIKSKLNEIDF